MNRVKLVKTLVVGILTVSLWVMIITVCLFSCQEIFPKVSLQNHPSAIGAIDEFLTSADDLDEDFELEYTFKGLNKHTWTRHCQSSLEQLCNYPIFPKAPDKRNFVPSVDIISTVSKVDSAVRLLGYVRPNATGDYNFLVVSNGFAEVWLSRDTNWKQAKKIAYIKSQLSKKLAFETMKSQISDTVTLVARHKYFFEVIYVKGDQTSSEQLIQVAWKRPDRSGFELIDRQFFSLYTEDSGKAKLKIYDDELPDVLACVQLRRRFGNKYMKQEMLPYLERAAVDEALAVCDYKPSYLLDPKNLPLSFKQYHGVHRYVQKTYTYPFQSVNGVLSTKKVTKPFLAEFPLNEKEALSVIRKYFEATRRTSPRKYELHSIKRVEKKEDPKKGSRYLLELIVNDLTNGASYILAEYVFQPKGKNAALCYPKGLQWNRTADVYLILTAKNLGRWVHHFIKNVEEIVQETKDAHLHVVIFDFDSPDIDLEQAFKRSTLKNYHFISEPGNYSRTVSFSRAVQSIKDPDAIIVTIDMHLDLGSQLINDIRKHCIKGKMVYAPQIVYLNCNGSSALPKGAWFHYSYGTVAVYKEDWEKFGGFSKGFDNKVTWGGEDWDIIDNAVKGGLEIERKRSPWVYHYYHTKAGMWQKKTNKVGTQQKSNKTVKVATQQKSNKTDKAATQQKAKANKS